MKVFAGFVVAGAVIVGLLDVFAVIYEFEHGNVLQGWLLIPVGLLCGAMALSWSFFLRPSR